MSAKPASRVVPLLGLFFSCAVLAADINVDTIADENDGSCTDGDCSLRDAIAGASSGDRILLPAGNYVLDPALGELQPMVSMEIVGAGAQSTIIDGDGNNKVFFINFFDIGSVIDVTMEALTVTNGAASGVGRGGGIHSRGVNVILRDCVVSNSSAFNGGGVTADGGSLFIERCAILDNLADGNSAGGILSSASDLTLLDSTVSGNSAPSQVAGGIGLFDVFTGGEVIPIGDVLIRDSTIVGNQAAAGGGGGIHISSSEDAPVSISNSIVANNIGGDCSEALNSLGYNLDSDGNCGLSASGDLPNTSPDLGARALNGGQTPNFLPNTGSPVINAGNPATADSGDASCTAIDQRGLFIPAGTDCDIGSTELDGVPPQFTVGGTVSGLEGDQVVLQNNGGDDLAITADGAFTFPTTLDDGSAYNVTVATQPSSPTQTCTVTNGSGTLDGANVTNVEVTCRAFPFAPIPTVGRFGQLVLMLMVGLLGVRLARRLGASRAV